MNKDIHSSVRVPLSLILNVSGDGASLGNLFQCLTMFITKNLLIIFNLNLFCFSVKPFPLVLSQQTLLKNLSDLITLFSVVEPLANMKIMKWKQTLQDHLCAPLGKVKQHLLNLAPDVCNNGEGLSLLFYHRGRRLNSSVKNCLCREEEAVDT